MDCAKRLLSGSTARQLLPHLGRRRQLGRHHGGPERHGAGAGFGRTVASCDCSATLYQRYEQITYLLSETTVRPNRAQVVQYAHPGGYPDPDNILGPHGTVGRVTESQARVQMVLWSLMPTQLILGEDEVARVPPHL